MLLFGVVIRFGRQRVMNSDSVVNIVRELAEKSVIKYFRLLILKAYLPDFYETLVHLCADTSRVDLLECNKTSSKNVFQKELQRSHNSLQLTGEVIQFIMMQKHRNIKKQT